MSIFTRAFNRLGGYKALAERFPGGPEPQGPRWERSSVGFGGSMRYDLCVTVVVARDGLWLQARPPAQGAQAAILVPWADIRDVRPVRLYWRRAVRLSCGDGVGTLTVWQRIWDSAEQVWKAAWAGLP